MSEEYVGLEDNGKEVISCLGCGENLGIIWDVDPNVETKDLKIKAVCPFCGDNSKTYETRKNSRIGIPDSGKIEYIEFGDYDGETQSLLPKRKD